MVEFQLEATSYETSLKILKNIIEFIQPCTKENKECLRFLARHHHLKGVCLERYTF